MAKCTLGRTDKGIAHVVKDLSNPPYLDATSGGARQEDPGAWGDPRAPGARTSDYARSTAAVRVTPDTREGEVTKT